MRTTILSVPCNGSSSSVIITLIGHDHKIAAMLDHPADTGRWIDQYEVRRTASYVVPAGKVTTPDLAEAVRLGEAFHADAEARAAESRWEQAVRDCLFITHRLGGLA